MMFLSSADVFFKIGYFSDPSFVAAPVTAFHHAPMADGWDNIVVGMKVKRLDVAILRLIMKYQT